MRRFRKDDLENQLNRGAVWAVTYGDLMSYLMIFFLILFSFSLAKSTDKKNRYEESLVNIQKAFGGKVDAAKLEKIMAKQKEAEASKKLEEMVQQAKLSEMVDIQSTEEKIKLTLQAPVLFKSGSADLTEEGGGVLGPLVDLLNATPNQIVVEGHTDNVPVAGGRFSSNWELSMGRAYSVIRFLESRGIPSSRLAGAGYGENRPVAANDTPENKSRNRRIEISLMRK